MTLALLDTCAYLRLAKRIRPLLGVQFGQKNYVLTVLSQVEQEVKQSDRLRFLYPWFETVAIRDERHAKTVRLSTDEKASINAAASVLRAYALDNAMQYVKGGRSPPSYVDCYCLAFGQIRPAIVITDDLGMHLLAETFEIPIWHGHELLQKMLSARVIDQGLVQEIFEALENNGDLPHRWQSAKHTTFKKVFGTP